MGIINSLLGSEGPDVSKESIQGAERRAMLDFGLGMLSQSAGGAGTNFGTALATGAIAGRAAFDDFISQSAAREAKERREGIISLGPDTSIQVLRQLWSEAVREGDTDMARTVADLIKHKEDLAVEAGTTVADNIVIKVDPTSDLLFGLNELTGDVVWQQTVPEDVLVPALRPEMITLRDNFIRDTADSWEIANSLQRVMSGTQTAIDFIQAQKNGTIVNGTIIDADGIVQEVTTPRAAAMTAISAFAKLLDPGSVVREGEFHIAWDKASGGFADKIDRWLEMMKQGILPQGMMQSLQEQAIKLAQAQTPDWDRRHEQLANGARALNIDMRFLNMVDPFKDVRDLVTTDYAALANGYRAKDGTGLVGQNMSAEELAQSAQDKLDAKGMGN